MTQTTDEAASTIGTDAAWWLRRMLEVGDNAHTRSANGQLLALLIMLEAAVEMLCTVDPDAESVAAAKAIAENAMGRMAQLIERAEAAVAGRATNA